MSNLKLPKWQIKIIVEMYSLANKYGTVSDVTCLVEAMSRACPGIAEVTAAHARILMCQRDYVGARDLLMKSHDLHPANAVLKALLAFCLFNLRDSVWEAYAEDALGLPHDEIAHAIIRTISELSNKQLRGSAEMCATSPSATADFTIPMSGLAC